MCDLKWNIIVGPLDPVSPVTVFFPMGLVLLNDVRDDGLGDGSCAHS